MKMDAQRPASWLGFGLLAVVAALGVWWWLKPVSGPGGPGGAGVPTAVEAVAIGRGDLVETLTLPAQVEALRGVTLQAEVSGKVSHLPEREGERVAAGEVLLELDPRPAQAEATRTNAELMLASTTLARLQQANQNGAASPLELDEAKARYQLARGAALAAKATLDKHIIRAPFAGQAGLQQVVLGQSVIPGQALISVVDDRLLRLRFTLPEQTMGQAQPGLAVEIRTPRGSLATSLTTLDSLIDPTTRTRAAQVLVAASEAVPLGLQAGQFVEVAVPLRLAEEALLLPAMALLPGLEGPRVMVVSGTATRVGATATAVATPVKILARSSETVAVTGLREGQWVVVAGQHKLRGETPAIRLVTPTAIPFIPAQAETLR